MGKMVLKWREEKNEEDGVKMRGNWDEKKMRKRLVKSGKE